MSSKRRIRRRQCGKIRYPSEAEARTAMVAALRRGQRWMGTYQCRFCGSWHIGHMPAQLRALARLRARQRREAA